MGATNEPLFATLMANVPDGLFQRAGSYEDPAPRGLPCKLTVIFEEKGETTKFEYEYGSESPGPPAEISRLVVKAIELTDRYYVKQGRKGIISGARDAIKRFWG